MELPNAAIEAAAKRAVSASAEDPIKIGLLRIVAYIPWIAQKLAESGAVHRDTADRTIYVDSRGDRRVIEKMDNGHLHNAARKLEREGRQPEALEAMKAEIARRAALR